ncbi:chemotaxis protein CheW [Jeotgalibacillus campisalis]|uniref:Chemotaxis protein n=1 Tax=Jeotgalibacillus campisalis TaxID=220754 RepID=A0A0C2VAA3_9BACL|nr:chemotaxis protein CheW [Jeotgalibacillus campisalis]KIL45907.1 chemotaxis protein [Jeotgalibacillus campisalis]
MDNSQKYVIFTSGSEEYAVKIESVLSIEKNEAISPIPHLPDYMLGITNVRGDLLPVLDYEKILGQRTGNEMNHANILVLKTDNLILALRVKEAREILSLSDSSIKEMGLIAYSKANYITGIAQVENRLITLVDPAKMANSLEGMKEVVTYIDKLKTETNAAL